MLCAFAVDYPGEEVVWSDATADRRALFVVTRSRRNGLVQAFGRRFVTRLFDAGSVDLEADSGATIRITMLDLGWSGGRFSFRTAEQARAVLNAWHGTDIDRASAA